MMQASAEKFKHNGPAEKKRVASVPQESGWQVRHSHLCQKKKQQSRLSRVPDHEGERVKMGESRTLAKMGDQSESMERKGWTPQ